MTTTDPIDHLARQLVADRDSVTANLTAARDRLAQMATVPEHVDWLAEQVNVIAGYEGARDALTQIEAALTAYTRGDMSRDTLLAYVARLGLRSPDDTWSGRVNDCRRARHDGLVANVARWYDTLDRTSAL